VPSPRTNGDWHQLVGSSLSSALNGADVFAMRARSRLIVRADSSITARC
jgi:hypothetical protein